MNAYIDISNVVLETDRLILRPWNDNDLYDLYEYARVDGVGQMAGWLPHENIEKTREILTMFIEGKITFALEYKENHKVIGSLGIENVSEIPHMDETKKGRELGFVLSKDYWGKGLMVEACKKVIDYLFNTLNLDYITCGYFTSNNQSKRVQEKLGFKYVYSKKHTTRYGLENDAIINILEK